MPNTPRLGLPYPAATDPADVPKDMQALADKLDSLVYIIGELRVFGMLNPPAKWLVSGALVLQADYPELYAAVSTLWNIGGETGAQFRAGPPPGRALVLAGQGQGLTNRAIGARWGVETVALTGSQMPVHNHGGGTGGGLTGNNGVDHVHGAHGHSPDATIDGGGTYNVAGQVVGGYTGAMDRSAMHQHSIPSLAINNDGGGAAHENLPPSVAVLVCIYAGR